MKIITLLICSLFVISCERTDLVHFTNNFEVIAQTDNTLPTLSSRLLKVREFGECDNNSCPKEVVYIAVSEFGEYPEQALYVSPKANKWQFIEWNHIPQLGESNPTIIFTLKSTNNSVAKIYTIKVNLLNIEYINNP